MNYDDSPEARALIGRVAHLSYADMKLLLVQLCHTQPAAVREELDGLREHLDDEPDLSPAARQQVRDALDAADPVRGKMPGSSR